MQVKANVEAQGTRASIGSPIDGIGLYVGPIAGDSAGDSRHVQSNL